MGRICECPDLAHPLCSRRLVSPRSLKGRVGRGANALNFPEATATAGCAGIGLTVPQLERRWLTTIEVLKAVLECQVVNGEHAAGLPHDLGV